MADVDRPEPADLAAHLGITPPVEGSDAETVLQRALDVAHKWITDRYVADPYDHDHVLAELHMAARWHQAKGAPLGVLNGGDLGSTYVPARNAVVREMLGDPIGGFA